MFWTAVGKNGAFTHDIGAIAYAQGFADVVVGNEYANISFRKLADNILDIDDRNRIDPGKRFVEQDKLRLISQCARYFDASAFAADSAMPLFSRI